MLYKNPLQAFAVIYRNEGIRGLQQGLACGYYYQLALNGCRIGFYEPSRFYLSKAFAPSHIMPDGQVKQSLSINVLAGFVSGASGAVLASRCFDKTRMQSFSASNTGGAAVGQQTFIRIPGMGFPRFTTVRVLKGCIEVLMLRF